jgi:hypothetical protein
MQMSGPNVQVPPPELADMAERAAEVVRRLEEYRRLYLSEAERKIDGGPATVEDHRPPKRPWEDVSRDGKAGPEPVARPAEPVGKPQSAAERDMEIIRKKRAATAAGGSGSAGQPKSKYRKRSVSPPLFSIGNLKVLQLILCFAGSGLNSGRHHQANVIPVTFAKLQNGDVDPMALGRCAMPVDCVSRMLCWLYSSLPNVLLFLC